MITSQLSYPPIKAELQDHGDFAYTLVVHPLTPGFGYTLGNSLRRIMLTSIPGYAVTKVRINDITHEYQAIKGVKEDALDVLLNLKALRAKIISDAENVTLSLKTTKSGDIKAKDFEKNSEVEIVNKDLYICNVSEGAKLEIEIEISKGYGYVSYEKRDLRGNTEPTSLLIDALYTPVRNVALEVEQTRVGDQTNFDKVSINFETDGTVSGQDIAEFATKIAMEMFGNIHSALSASEDGKQLTGKSSKTSQASQDTIELAPRIVKILEKNDITTNTELQARLDEIQDLPGLGDKAIEQIKEYIEGLK